MKQEYMGSKVVFRQVFANFKHLFFKVIGKGHVHPEVRVQCLCCSQGYTNDLTVKPNMR